MKAPIDGGVILITGASAGIGVEFARQLAHRAKALILVARRVERLESLKWELIKKNPRLQITVHSCDLVDRVATDKMIASVTAQFGSIDILINNAGMGDYRFFEKTSWDKTEQLLGLNVTSLVYLTHKFVGPMIEKQRGGILNVSSGFGFQFLPGFAAYVGSKHFVTGFTEVLRSELRSRGIVVSQLCPGPVATEFEAVAGDLKNPPLAEISAQKCASWAICGFERDRALIVPGFLISLGMLISAWSPKFMQRIAANLVARRMLRRLAG